MNQTTIGDVIGNDNVVGSNITIYNYNSLTSNIKLHDIESMTGESGTLRACLKSEEQAYIPLDDSWVENQLATLIINKTEPYLSKPLVIKGFGGLGKTRLALEICRLAKTQHQAKTLLLNNAHADLTQLITEAKQQKQHLILLIDYLEYFTKANQNGYSFDSLRQDIHDLGEGWVHLVLTTRYLPNQTGFPRNGLSLYERLGAETLTETYCHILDLTAYQEWRIKVCETIYARSKEQNINNPLIATLLNYWEKREIVLPNAQELGQDNRWLLRHLCHEFLSELNSNHNGEYELTYLLLLFPFNQKTYEQILKQHSHFKKWLNALEHTGLVHSYAQHDDIQWKLDHDLLADIAFSEFLLSNSIPRQRNEQVTQLLTDAQKIGRIQTMIANLLQALNHKSRLNHGFGDAEHDSDLNIYKIILKQIADIADDAQNLTLGHVFNIMAASEYAYTQWRQNKDFRFDQAIWEQLRESAHDICHTYANQAFFNYASGKYQKEKDSSVLQSVWQKFGEDAENINRFLAAHAAFLYAQDKHDIGIYQRVWQQFGKEKDNKIQEDNGIHLEDILETNNTRKEMIINIYDGIRLTGAEAAFKCAALKYQQENDFSFYQKVWQQFGNDTYGEIRFWGAGAALNCATFNYAASKDRQENDFSLYLTIWEQFGKDANNKIRRIAFLAAFQYARHQAKQEKDFLGFYQTVWELFGEDEEDKDEKIRLLAVITTCSYTVYKCLEGEDEQIISTALGLAFYYVAYQSKQKKDFSFYQAVWEQFDKDAVDEIYSLFVLAVRVVLLYAEYQTIVEKCDKDTKDELRLLVTDAALHYAYNKATQENDINFYPIVWEQFKNDEYPPIQQQAFSAKLNYIDWQIALGQAETAYQDGLRLLNHPLLDKDNNAALHFLLWLAQPTPETQQVCDNAVASLNGEAIGWKFDEFAERIASFSDENQAYAKHIIGLLEQSTP